MRDCMLIEGRRIPLADLRREAGAPDSPFVTALLAEAPLDEGAAAHRDFLVEAGRFIADFLDPAPVITVHTSGSTGAPKPFAAEKARMRASARMTAAFLGLEPGGRNLLAMPLRFIAGRMVVVRSIECGLDLVAAPPKRNPFAGVTEPFALAAVTPMQAVSILDDPASAEVFLGCSNILIGGGAADEDLRARLEAARGRVWATYGMTETLSHVALRLLTGPDADPGFRALPGVELSLSEKGTLAIKAPAVAAGTLVTNDVVRFSSDGAFTVTGRLDNVINSGGIKVHPEVVEAKLKPLLPMPFAIAPRPDRLLGEEVVLVVEGTPDAAAALDLMKLRAVLGRYECPKAVVAVPKLPLTATMKPDRPAIRAAAAAGLKVEAPRAQPEHAGRAAPRPLPAELLHGPRVARPSPNEAALRAAVLS